MINKIKLAKPILFFSFLFFAFTPDSLAQVDSTLVGIKEVYPVFPGGEKALVKFVIKHTRYPKDALRKEITGTVEVKYVIDKDGFVTNVEIKKGVYKALDAEAIRVVSLFPRHTIGYQNGLPTRVQFSIPIIFSLKSRKKNETSN